MTAAAVAALTVYDMCKAVSKGIIISQVRLEAKSGGKSGSWTQPTLATLAAVLSAGVGYSSALAAKICEVTTQYQGIQSPSYFTALGGLREWCSIHH